MDSWIISFRARSRGPITSHQMDRDIAAYEHDVAKALGEAGEDMWVDALQDSIRKPTPYYWTQIEAREVSATRYKVDDHDIVYGPWLEGVGSRNAPNSIFPGYWSLAKSKEMLKRRRGGIARRILREYRASGRII